ncbi:hypothetical protein B0H14DRAFT_2958750 [Mycena olivaceomarginata]|nr:hypothetical protein B0H14DRAFT_2958750 [Mycena olivaceomarginata]
MFLLYFFLRLILCVQSLPTPDTSMNLNSSMNFSTSGNSSALIEVGIEIKDIIQPPEMVQSSSQPCAQGTT